jgi:hypothetical protein
MERRPAQHRLALTSSAEDAAPFGAPSRRLQSRAALLLGPVGFRRVPFLSQLLAGGHSAAGGAPGLPGARLRTARAGAGPDPASSTPRDAPLVGSRRSNSKRVRRYGNYIFSPREKRSDLSEIGQVHAARLATTRSLLLRRRVRREARAVVRRGEIQFGADRHDAGRVHLAVTRIIVGLDVIQVHRLGDARHLIQLAHIVRQVGIVFDAADVAFEVAVINGIEADERGEQAPVGFGQCRADEIALRCETLSSMSSVANSLRQASS